jgi:hypothetical protein
MSVRTTAFHYYQAAAVVEPCTLLGVTGVSSAHIACHMLHTVSERHMFGVVIINIVCVGRILCVQVSAKKQSH